MIAKPDHKSDKSSRVQWYVAISTYRKLFQFLTFLFQNTLTALRNSSQAKFRGLEGNNEGGVGKHRDAMQCQYIKALKSVFLIDKKSARRYSGFGYPKQL
jgi:hypothetical protein